MNAISITLSEEQIALIKRNVAAKFTEELYTEVKAQLNAKQLVGEVKNAVVGKIADEIKRELKNVHRVDEALHRALQSAEARLNTEIHKRLSQGIVVRFGNNA